MRSGLPHPIVQPRSESDGNFLRVTYLAGVEYLTVDELDNHEAERSNAYTIANYGIPTTYDNIVTLHV